MDFPLVIAQTAVKAILHKQLSTRNIPHAQLFCGPEGCGKLPMALDFAKAILCQAPKEGMACGECRSCKMLKHWEHPDLHFVLPVKKTKDTPTTDAFLKEWRTEISQSPYIDLAHWYDAMKVENQQPIISVAEAERISEKLIIAAQQGGYKVVIIWHPELMIEAAANKLLKILEEPPRQTVFILVSDEPEKILTTILSRTQRISFPALTDEDIKKVLVEKHGLETDMAQFIAHNSAGNYIQAARQLQINEDQAVFFDMFVQLMRKAYLRDIRELFRWSEIVATWGREKQKNFLQYCQHMVRENFIFNFHDSQLNYLSQKERDFSVRFSPYINERNVIGIMDELAMAERDVAQNVNAKMVFFDFTLKIIVLLIQ